MAHSVSPTALHTAASFRESVIEVRSLCERGRYAPNRPNRIRGARRQDPRLGSEAGRIGCLTRVRLEQGAIYPERVAAAQLIVRIQSIRCTIFEHSDANRAAFHNVTASDERRPAAVAGCGGASALSSAANQIASSKKGHSGVSGGYPDDRALKPPTVPDDVTTKVTTTGVREYSEGLSENLLQALIGRVDDLGEGAEACDQLLRQLFRVAPTARRPPQTHLGGCRQPLPYRPSMNLSDLNAEIQGPTR